LETKKQDSIPSLLSRIFNIDSRKLISSTPKKIGEDLTKILNGKNLYLSSDYLPKFYAKFIFTGDDLMSKFNDYGSMCKDPILSMALEYITDDATQYSPITKKRIWTVGEDQDLIKINEDFYNRININERIWYIVSRTCAFGNCFVRMFYANKDNYSGGIDHIEVENDLLRYIPIEISGVLIKWIDKYTNEMLEPFEVICIKINSMNDQRLINDYYDISMTNTMPNRMNRTLNTFVYGTSFFDNCRRIWKQRILAEDSIMLTRLENAPLIWIMKLALQGVSPETASAWVEKLSDTFNYDGNKTLNLAENIIRGNDSQASYGSKIILPMNNTQDMDISTIGGNADVQYIRDLDRMDTIFYASLRIPKEFLGMVMDLPSSLGESTLRQLEMRYARTLKKVQYSVMNAFKIISYYNYLSKGILTDFTEDYDIVMQTASNAEDEEFKNAFSSGIDSFEKFTKLLGDIKDVLGMQENNESVIELFNFLTKRVLNVSDFNWDKFFNDFSGSMKGEEGSKGMKDQFESKKKSIVNYINNSNKYNVSKELLEKYNSIKKEDRERLVNKINNFVMKENYFIPKFSLDNNLISVKENFSKIIDQKKYIKEDKVINKKLDLNTVNINKIITECRYFDISIFNQKTEEKEFDITKYKLTKTEVVKKLDKELIFLESIFDVPEIVNSNLDDVVIYKYKDNCYINHSNSCKYLKAIKEKFDCKFKIVSFDD
jgi:hypothetical protein